MVLSTITVAAKTTPTVLSTGLSHYLLHRHSNKGKPAEHIGYNEGLHLVRKFLEYASHRPVEELQAFTQQYVPVPTWVHVEEEIVSQIWIDKAAEYLVNELGVDGCEAVGGRNWWRWRGGSKGKELRVEWIEMKKHRRERLAHKERAPRTMLYVHGGAYFFGSVDEHRYQMQRHARKLKARVFAPRYRLAPQFPFPCGLLDVLSSYLYLLTIQPASTIILSGDSAGGGMILSLLCLLRNQDIPLPAGAILISPWVDLTHSFPSITKDASLDYVPSHGFFHRPSPAWPPPTQEDIDNVSSSNKTGGTIAGGSTLNGILNESLTSNPITRMRRKSRAQKADLQEQAQGFGITRVGTDTLHQSSVPSKRPTVVIAGHEVKILDQIQMYTTNELLNHPLVSPVLQGSLGGLPPILVLVGGGEILRDEQIFMAHKAANPKKYPPSDTFLSNYPREGGNFNKWSHGTDVMLQVYDDCCHVTPTLSFTNPAKYMYRSISRFGDWLLSKNVVLSPDSMQLNMRDEPSTTNAVNGTARDEVGTQDVPLVDAQAGGEIIRAETDSIISSSSSSNTVSTKSEDLEGLDDPSSSSLGSHIDRVSSIKDVHLELPPFVNHMIRQRIDRHGNILLLPSASELPAMQVSPNEMGVIKPEPVRRWMEVKARYDTKYAKAKRKVQHQRAREIAEGGYVEYTSDDGVVDKPPPSALAGRRRKNDISELYPDRSSTKPSWGLRFWSMMGAKQDRVTLENNERKEKDAYTQHQHQVQRRQSIKKQNEARRLQQLDGHGGEHDAGKDVNTDTDTDVERVKDQHYSSDSDSTGDGVELINSAGDHLVVGTPVGPVITGSSGGIPQVGPAGNDGRFLKVDGA